jgi:hypothetical protein
MQAMGRVRLIADPGPSAARTPRVSRAWLLDADAFHDQIEPLYADLDTAEGLARLRWLATQVWRAPDEAAHGYLDLLEVGTADEWEAGHDRSRLGQWYRVLMAPHLRPLPSVTDPRALRDGLVHLGWTPAEARRLAFGRELTSLVEAFGSDWLAEELGPMLTLGSRGWLDDDDVASAIARLHGLDPAAFRGAPHLVPLVEQLHDELLAAAEGTDGVLLLVDGP